MKDLFSLIVLLALAAMLWPFAAVAVKYHVRGLAWNEASTEQIQRMLAYNCLLADMARSAELPQSSEGNFVGGGHLTAFNASMFDQSTFSERLTGYAVGFRDQNNIKETLDFVAPPTPSPRKAEFTVFSSAEEFLSTGLHDDLRAIGGDFPTLRFDAEKVIKRLLNRGIAVELDADQIAEIPNWQELYTGRLVRILYRNSLRRAIALLSAAAVNTDKTWSTAAGKDPDADVEARIIAGQNISGIRANRAIYGDTSWDTRKASHRAQNTAGGFASAQMTPDELAGYLNLDGVKVSRERYAASKTAASVSEIVSNKVILFNAMDNASEEDPSNIKRFTGFVSDIYGGGEMAVHLREVGDKRWRLAVEMYELTAITAAFGIEQITTARS